MSIKLRTPSNGSVTLLPQDTASDVVVTVPAGDSTIVTNATLPTQLNASGSAPIYACRAWVNFNGTGTVAIRASGNVSSITDAGAGQYEINFSTSMPDENYSVVALCVETTALAGKLIPNLYNRVSVPTAAKCGISFADPSTGNFADTAYAMAAIFR